MLMSDFLYRFKVMLYPTNNPYFKFINTVWYFVCEW